MNTLYLVNRTYPLPNDYVPKHLVQDRQSLIWVCAPLRRAFKSLNKQLKKEGFRPLVLISGYRPYSYQKELFERKKQLFLEQGLEELVAYQKASQIVAPPGCSEHQLGLAVDVTTWSMKELEDPLLSVFGESKEGLWLQKYAHHYGFILRYPLDKIDITGVSYEPWHYRYVSPKHATIMQEKQLTLEEYSALLKG